MTSLRIKAASSRITLSQLDLAFRDVGLVFRVFTLITRNWLSSKLLCVISRAVWAIWSFVCRGGHRHLLFGTNPRSYRVSLSIVTASASGRLLIHLLPGMTHLSSWFNRSNEAWFKAQRELLYWCYMRWLPRFQRRLKLLKCISPLMTCRSGHTRLYWPASITWPHITSSNYSGMPSLENLCFLLLGFMRIRIL